MVYRVGWHGDGRSGVILGTQDTYMHVELASLHGINTYNDYVQSIERLSSS